MAKALLRLFPLLIAFSAFAQTPEAPAEKANPLVVGIFILLFVGACAGYFVYMWWEQRKSKQQGVVEKQR